MGKGQAFVNGENIRRYWPAYLAPLDGCTENCDYRGSYDASKCLRNCGQPAQTLYHIPRTLVHPGENLLVLHEELGDDPSKISFFTKTGLEICAHVSEANPPPADSWKPDLGFMPQSPEVRLSCERGWRSRLALAKRDVQSVSTTNLGDPCPRLTKSFSIAVPDFPHPPFRTSEINGQLIVMLGQKKKKQLTVTLLEIFSSDVGICF